MTRSAPAICGTRSARTKLTASTPRQAGTQQALAELRAELRRQHDVASLWSPSRGATSQRWMVVIRCPRVAARLARRRDVPSSTGRRPRCQRPGRGAPGPAYSPGVSESFGTTPGAMYVAELVVRSLDEHSRARSCGSAKMSAIVATRPAGDAGGVEDLVDLRRGSRLRPARDDALDLGRRLRARERAWRNRGSSASSGRPIAATQPPEHAVHVGRDHHPPRVGRAEDVRRHDAGEPGPRRPARDT